MANPIDLINPMFRHCEAQATEPRNFMISFAFGCAESASSRARAACQFTLRDFPCAAIIVGCRPQLLCHQPTIQNDTSSNPHMPLHTACTLGRAWLIAPTTASKAKQVPMKASVDKIYWNVDAPSNEKIQSSHPAQSLVSGQAPKH